MLLFAKKPIKHLRPKQIYFSNTPSAGKYKRYPQMASGELNQCPGNYSYDPRRSEINSLFESLKKLTGTEWHTDPHLS